MQQDWNIRDIIDNESLVVHFHPIVSLKERDIVKPVEEELRPVY